LFTSAVRVAPDAPALGRRDAECIFAWGAGHATSLFLPGLPIVRWRAYLPHRVQEAADVVVGILLLAGLRARALGRLALRVAPCLSIISLGFGRWYTASAVGL
jgi:hypothetical protein